MAHILNGCQFYKGLFIARHDRIVNIIMQTVRPISHTATFYCNKAVNPSMFELSNNVSPFDNVTANIPDGIRIDEAHREVVMLEVGYTFDSSLEEAFNTKQLKVPTTSPSYHSARLQLSACYLYIWQFRPCP